MARQRREGEEIPTFGLPIEPALPTLKAALAERTAAVLVAPPGAGKTTRVPLALLDEPWLAGRHILMLEPRRLAARTAARYMAASLGEQVGETVGYRVRLETRVGARTRVEVITEGVLTRLLQADPALEHAGLVILDEFHERSLHADLGLALCLQSQSLLRGDLRILAMSATLDAQPVASLLGGAPIIVSEGRSFPVQTRYAPRRPEGRIEQAVARTALEALASHEGDILAFLPGAAEIRRVQELMADPRVVPLYGNLPQAEQDRAILPSPPGRRKVVLATSIAETSLTVEGVRVVIDSGLSRVPRFSPRTGMTRLETVPVSQASADQRRGRAGRLAPGVCYRLWAEQEQLVARGTPEILEADLAPLALELAAWGVTDAAELCWLDPPPAAALAQARELLRQLGAMRSDFSMTPHGRRMAEVGLHPRLSHMILRAIAAGAGGSACELAALLSERDLLRGAGADADIGLRIDLVRRGAPEARQIVTQARQLKAGFDIRHDEPAGAPGPLLALAYPDRIAARRGNGRFLLRNGRGAAFAQPHQPLAEAPFLVAVDLDDQGAESRIFLAAPLELTDIERHFGDQIEDEELIVWDRPAQAVRARRRRRLGAIILQEAPLPDPDPGAVAQALTEAVRQEGLDMLPWTRNARQFQQRVIFMHRRDPSWPDASDEALLANAAEWLTPHLYGLRSRSDLQQLQMASALEGLLSPDRRRRLDELAPTHITVPSGSRIPVDYSNPDAPVLAVRLQEMFGLADTPRIVGGAAPLILHLLSPAHRPVQVTQDLASFWRSAYFEVRKDLRGRYPKHYWPDDPWNATPTHRTRPRS
ncbi:MAG TPA: ATP-dependent helicase HrpB [Symbiobacteriaceae bacterium]|nr:ATP-dependent helicase HrpB [Symbiobacteriaceae bacterium]